jgi:hypothetical protein
MWGAPIALALFVSVQSSIVDGNSFSLTASSTRFVEVGTSFDVTIGISTEDPINVAAAIVSYPPTLLQVTGVSSDETAIDLWAEEPFFSNELGVVTFAGGLLKKAGFTGTGTVATIHFSAVAAGSAHLDISSPALLAHDGKGTNVLTHTSETTVVVREVGQANPDINGDGSVTITDINSMYLTILRPYNARYDMDGNGKVNFRDIAHLFGLLGS